MSKTPLITHPEIYYKKWGYEKWIVNNEKYCGKILHFYQSARLSAHFHKLKHEHFHVLEGLFLCKLWNKDASTETFYLKPNDTVEIAPPTIHQLFCLQEGDILEVSTQHFDDDSYRIEPSCPPMTF